MATAVSSGEQVTTVIRPTRGWQAVNLREVWRYRDLLLTLAERDVKLRYRQTVLGVIWVVLQPLVGAGIFAFVFGRVAGLSSEGIPYFVFAYAGLLGWGAFLNTFTRASNSLVGNAHLVSKVYFPRLVLPLSTVLSALLDFAVAFAVMLVLLVVYRVNPGLRLALLPLWLLLLVSLGVGLGLFAGALMVSYRDVQHALPVLVQFLLYATPVGYAVAAVPENLRAVYYLNPLAGALEAFRWSLLGVGTLSVAALAWSAVAAALALAWGATSFMALQRRFADVI
jgi:lipopolysaccharide transport system permease protein